MRKSAGISSQHCPFTVIPERGQITEHSSESASNESWTVFHERIAGSNLANDPRHVRPESRLLAVNSGALSGDADVLAGKAARYHVNNASPYFSSKTPNVIPNRERRENAFILSAGKYACCVGIDLDGADGPPSQ
jgi:hypothetical protein